MDTSTGLIAVIPARGGSKGLPGKNIRPFCGLPLIAHSILLAKSCPEIVRTIVSTDSAEIAEVAKKYGAEVPFLRPPELAGDSAPLWPVLRHTLDFLQQKEGETYRYLLLLDPTTPCRTPLNVMEAFQHMLIRGDADGIIGVSKPDFNPLWNCVAEKGGWMRTFFEEGNRIHRRQDAPEIFRINGSLYIWTTDFLSREKEQWRDRGNFLMYEVPDFTAISIDTLDEFERAELYVKSGLIGLPWIGINNIS
ncbi:MAG: CMP-N,N'-diacetyllegionaminic acid synthase [Elusimicrobia bacterium]|nr:CMP-N,N'-diacetyllegionaminic acid synthase [Elusimicrobiota bacterium]